VIIIGCLKIPALLFVLAIARTRRWASAAGMSPEGGSNSPAAEIRRELDRAWMTLWVIRR
jgi:hypothetical protein